jgi:eukaryotic-like serine/threonine-protein kinase
VPAEAKTTPMLCPACNTRYDEGGAFCARDGTPLIKDPQASKEDLVGQVLADRYRVVRLVGEGGMGQVYEAQHVNINKRFALKLLRPEIVSNADAVQRFRQEAWSASSIGHENIIEIEDFATLPSGAVYLAMEFLAGLSLAERMRQEPPIDFAQALDVVIQVASGLGAAHEKGIIHRDMKPENIFLAQKHGRAIVKILDFGIAKVSGADGNKSLTRTGTIFGTPHYMSPEQALGKALDHRSDIYSVGVIMYELFTGKVPFEAESFMGILTKHITSTPKPPREAAPDRAIPDEVEAVILRAMAKEPDERHQSMGELITDVAAVAAMRAPEILQPRAGSAQMHAAQISGAMAAKRMTPLPSRMPSGPQSLPAGASPLSPSSQQLEIKKRSLLPWLLVAGVALAAGGTAVVLVNRPHDTAKVVSAGVVGNPAQQPGPIVAPPATTTTTTTTATGTTATPPTNVPPPAAPVMEEVIVDSVPPGAKIFVDGQPVADTPEALKVEPGKPKSIVIKKDGFVDASETLDPGKSHKVLVRLEHIHKKSAPATKLPAPPPVPVEPPHVTAPPPVVRQPPPRPRPRPVDPYERVDEPKKGGDVLNPY